MTPVADRLGTVLDGGHPLARHIVDFLTDVKSANKSGQTIRAYRGDLAQFAAYHDGEIGELDARPVRAYLADIAKLAPSSRRRKRAAIASFCKWAVRHDLLDKNPMDKIDTIAVPRTLPRPADPDDVKKLFAQICTRRPRKDVPIDRLRDRVLFETAYVCGARASEVCGMYVEDLDLRLDDEHARVHGKGGSVRTVLLDDRGYAALLKLYLARTNYKFGPLFRASINGSGGPLSYDAAHHRWQNYCTAAGVEIDIHQLRHAHATELINNGVSIEAVRRRLGHASTETTQIYTLLADKIADDGSSPEPSVARILGRATGTRRPLKLTDPASWPCRVAVRSESWRPLIPHAAVTSASIIAVITCSPVPTASASRPSRTSPTNSASATLTRSGTAGWLVSNLSFWYFFPTAVPFLGSFLVGHPSTYRTAGLRRGTAA
jgi:integrase/recombinase XerD